MKQERTRKLQRWIRSQLSVNSGTKSSTGSQSDPVSRRDSSIYSLEEEDAARNHEASRWHHIADTFALTSARHHIADTFALTSARHLAPVALDDKSDLKVHATQAEVSPVSTATSTPRDDARCRIPQTSSDVSNRLSFGSQVEWIFYDTEDGCEECPTCLHFPLRPDVPMGRRDPEQVCATWCPMGSSCAAHGGAVWYGDGNNSHRRCTYNQNLENCRGQFRMDSCLEALPQQPAELCQPSGFFSAGFFSS